MVLILVYKSYVKACTFYCWYGRSNHEIASKKIEAETVHTCILWFHPVTFIFLATDSNFIFSFSHTILYLTSNLDFGYIICISSYISNNKPTFLLVVFWLLSTLMSNGCSANSIIYSFWINYRFRSWLTLDFY